MLGGEIINKQVKAFTSPTFGLDDRKWVIVFFTLCTVVTSLAFIFCDKVYEPSYYKMIYWMLIGSTLTIVGWAFVLLFFIEKYSDGFELFFGTSAFVFILGVWSFSYHLYYNTISHPYKSPAFLLITQLVFWSIYLLCFLGLKNGLTKSNPSKVYRKNRNTEIIVVLCSIGALALIVVLITGIIIFNNIYIKGNKNTQTAILAQLLSLGIQFIGMHSWYKYYLIKKYKKEV